MKRVPFLGQMQIKPLMWKKELGDDVSICEVDFKDLKQKGLLVYVARLVLRISYDKNAFHNRSDP